MTTRNAAPRGAMFYREGDRVMFVHEVDAATTFGPIEATPRHQVLYPQAWASFCAAEPDPHPAPLAPAAGAAQGGGQAAAQRTPAPGAPQARRSRR